LTIDIPKLHTVAESFFFRAYILTRYNREHSLQASSYFFFQILELLFSAPLL